MTAWGLLEHAVTYRKLGELYAGQLCHQLAGTRPGMLLTLEGVPEFSADIVEAVSLPPTAHTTPFLAKLLERQGIPVHYTNQKGW